MHAQKGPEELRVFVLVMVEGRGVRNRGVIKVLRVELRTVRLMVVGDGVSIWAARKVPKVGLSIALRMEVGDGVVTRMVVAKPLGAGQAFALNTVVERGAKWTAALVVQKDRLVCAYLMAVVDGASSKVATRAPRGARCIAKLTVVVNVVFSPGVQKGLKVVRRFVKPTVVENDAFMMVVGFVPKVFTEGPTFVSLTVAARGVLFLAVLRARVVGPTVA